jgi:hypothetical protein
MIIAGYSPNRNWWNLKNQPLKAQLHMAYDISTRLHKVYLDFFNFYIGGHFENFKNKEHNFE